MLRFLQSCSTSSADEGASWHANQGMDEAATGPAARRARPVAATDGTASRAVGGGDEGRAGAAGEGAARHPGARVQGDAAEPDQDLHGLHPEHQERQTDEDEGGARTADQGGAGEQHEALHPTAHQPETEAGPAGGEVGSASQGAGGGVEQDDKRGRMR